MLEKPFGHSLESARAPNRALSALAPADQVFRVDHWLATPTVVNAYPTKTERGTPRSQRFSGFMLPYGYPLARKSLS